MPYTVFLTAKHLPFAISPLQVVSAIAKSTVDKAQLKDLQSLVDEVKKINFCKIYLVLLYRYFLCIIAEKSKD